ncbi:unnamed protein product [Acanthoscelides obtectus]|uniref:Uncharacterized protein n=1 Tax=Acanthoscelides obtectus TaxID=200917 RepID=A0A9P0MCN9_ACAOB|nr:unnamed protein product [Acanthoscelides obtectus]CAK1638460.1 Probable serine carboxypeptidase CPVL [Acanthoscelides obtectus]
MDLQITSLFLLAYFLTSSEALFKALKTQDVEYDRDDVGEPLILTPLLEQEQIREARRAAIVNLTGDAKDVRSYAGYFTVNKRYNSNQFFWFFPSKSNPAKDPVLVWLQGGPGVSSMYGVLVETGPFFINKKQELELRKYSWVNNHSVIYIDNPVGTGFSFTKNEDGYARNETQIGNELYEALRQFFKLFSEHRKNEFYIHGESYAAKYALALAHTIHTNNPHAQEKINLKGVAIGDGYIDPEHQTGYAEYLYQLGLVDEKHAEEIKRYENAAVEAIRKGNYILSSDLKVKALVVIEQQANVSFYNYLKEGGVPGEDQMNNFLNQSEVRRSLHVGETTFGSEKVLTSSCTGSLSWTPCTLRLRHFWQTICKDPWRLGS